MSATNASAIALPPVCTGAGRFSTAPSLTHSLVGALKLSFTIRRSRAFLITAAGEKVQVEPAPAGLATCTSSMSEVYCPVVLTWNTAHCTEAKPVTVIVGDQVAGTEV